MKSRLIAITVAVALLTGCGTSGGGAPRSGSTPPQPPPFENRVWRVVEAEQIPIGTFYAFLSDNTLLITRPGETTPTLGRWHFAGGGLVIIEEGYRYPADILEWGEQRFSIRVHRGAAVEDVVMIPAK